jgi:hypothetical protein
MANIQRLAQYSQGAILCFAGTPLKKAAPTGVLEILRMRKQGSVKAALGLTPIKNSAAFTAPSIKTTPSNQRVGHQVQHFATFVHTTSQDATHDSYYPAPGIHQKPPQDGPNEFWEITEELSELVCEGEQEHLNDARRAYEITYKCIENEINRLVGKRFGPASTPGDAIDLAVAELGQRLPKQLGTDPKNWVATLDRLLLMTTKRDTNLWHSIETEEFHQDGNKRIERLRPATFFQVGVVPSSHVVHF